MHYFMQVCFNISVVGRNPANFHKRFFGRKQNSKFRKNHHGWSGVAMTRSDLTDTNSSKVLVWPHFSQLITAATTALCRYLDTIDTV